MPERNTTLVLTAHGSSQNPDSSAPTRALREQLARAGRFAAVRAAFWREEPPLSSALDDLATDEVIIVPIFMSDGYFVRTVLPRELGVGRGLDHMDGRRTYLCEPIGTHPTLATVVRRRALEVLGPEHESVAERAVLIVLGHGTERDSRSSETTYAHARRLAELGGFAEVRVAFMDEEPTVADVARTLGDRPFVAVPLFVADGFHAADEIPELLGSPPPGVGGELAARRGRWLARAVGSHPTIRDVVEQRIDEALGALRRPGAASGGH